MGKEVEFIFFILFEIGEIYNGFVVIRFEESVKKVFGEFGYVYL